MKNRIRVYTIICIFCIGLPLASFGKVVRVDFQSKELVLNGKEFGEYGAYEVLKGKVYYAFGADNYFNNPITDIQLAKKNSNGEVEAWGDIVVLQPRDESKRRGTALVEVSNRGGKFSPNYFNQATKTRELDPNDPAYWGDGLLMEQGLTVIWIGWQFDVPTADNVLKLHVPHAVQRDGKRITGMVRSDWTLDSPAKSLKLGHRQQIGYPAMDLNGDIHQLTVRDGRDAPRFEIPRDQWNFSKWENGKEVISDKHISLKGGFKEGKIYELVYQSYNPPIVGLGIAAIRDIISYAKYDDDCPFKVQYAIAAGVSQTGRFLRTMLYEGLNFDEVGRKAYDGMMVITAGAGRGSFNHRFAQPSRDAHRYSAFFYPTDIFPFTGKPQMDEGKEDALYNNVMLKSDPPKVFYVNTGYEYWGRSASLIHMNLEGTEDVTNLPFERFYHIASGQHFVNRFPPNPENEFENNQFQGNHLEFKVNYRALFIKLLEWVDKNIEPPASKIPTIADKTLVAKEQLNFPNIPNLQTPTTIHNAYRANYGESWIDGLIDHQPPILGKAFPAFVAQLDENGNETGGIRNVELEVPLATYTPWNLRHGMKGGYHELTDFRGTFIPFPKTELEKLKLEDPRPSIIGLYENKANFLQKVEDKAKSLVGDGFLLERDIDYVKNRNEAYWDWLIGDQRPTATTKGPENGTLMIIGGGRLDDVFYEKFMELAGGPESPIVVIPTAGSHEWVSTKDFQKNLVDNFKNKGFKKVNLIHTINPEEANSEKYVKLIEKAKGIWFTGGRQWRLVDAYAGTKMLEEIKKLLERGGVVAGSSAGATIQGSYLARGDTKTNTIMMGDHEEGFNFMTNVAIDQHLLARNRQFDVFEILEKHPTLLGIGLDENTGIVVKGDEFEVMGLSYVAVYDRSKWTGDFRQAYDLPEESEQFYFLKSGDKYDLKNRKIKIEEKD